GGGDTSVRLRQPLPGLVEPTRLQELPAPAREVPFVAPGVSTSLRPPAGSLPFCFGREPFPGPVAVGVCLPPRDAYDRLEGRTGRVAPIIPVGTCGSVGCRQVGGVVEAGDLETVDAEGVQIPVSNRSLVSGPIRRPQPPPSGLDLHHAPIE